MGQRAGVGGDGEVILGGGRMDVCVVGIGGESQDVYVVY